MKGAYACLLLLIGCGSVFAGVEHVESASGEVVIRNSTGVPYLERCRS